LYAAKRLSMMLAVVVRDVRDAGSRAHDVFCTDLLPEKKV
jgi:hypothetical protein